MVATFIANAPEPFSGDETADLKEILKEVRQGIPSHDKRLTEARDLQCFYEGDSERFIPSRPSEDNLSWLTRPKRVSYITRQVINKITSHDYKPGPRYRKITGEGREEVDGWYGRVVQDIQLNSVMQQADRMATLHGLCMIGIYPTNNARRPINYHLYNRADFCYWVSPDDPRVATAVCTVTKTNADTIRYRVWTASHYYTFFRKSAWGLVSGGMTVARYDPALSGPHGYGTLPFAFITSELPTTELETPGLGRLLRKINIALNTDKSNLALWVHHYARPLGFISGVGPEWRPKFIDGGFVPLVTRHDSTEDSPIVPSASYLESSFDIAAVREWIIGEANQALGELDIPITLASKASDGGGTGAPSGLAIAANDADLVTYAKAKQPLLETHETRLAALICKVGSSSTVIDAGLAEQLYEVADDMSLRVSWPQPQIDLPGQAQDLADQWELDNGLADPIEVMARRQGLTIDEALTKFRDVAIRRQQATVIATYVASLVDEEGNRVDAVDEPPPEPAEDEVAEEGEELTPDMGVPGGKPSDSAQPETAVSPSVTITSVVTPQVPIAGIEVAAATGGYSRGGTES